MKPLSALLLASAMFLPMAGQGAANDIRSFITSPVRDCPGGTNVTMPFIAWADAAVLLHANGNATTTRPGLFDDAGWTLTLEDGNDFIGQVSDLVSCRSPFLRGTASQIAAATPVTEADSRTELQVFAFQSFSLGDVIVGADGISRPKDLAGKTIAIQQFAPQVGFLARMLADAGLGFDDVTILWTQDMTGDGDTPLKRMQAGEADAAVVIVPDALTLTGGDPVTGEYGVGTGAEGSVQGATVTISTRSATTTVADYLAVRRDYFEAHRDEVFALMAAMLKAEEESRTIMASDGTAEQEALATLLANVALGGAPMEEGEALWADAAMAGWSGNVAHFTDPDNPRNYQVIMSEAFDALWDAGQISQKTIPAAVAWDYARLAKGLDDVSDRAIAEFDPDRAKAAVDGLRAAGDLDAAGNFNLTIQFPPGSDDFSSQAALNELDAAIDYMVVYGGSLASVDGNVDPLEIERAKRDGADIPTLKLLRAEADNLSKRRAQAAVNALIARAEERNIDIDPNRFVVDGVGAQKPLYPIPTTETEWAANMRAEVRILKVIVEATQFVPLGG